MINFNGKTRIGRVIEFNFEKQRESKGDRLQVRVEPVVAKRLKELNAAFYPDLDFPAFHRMILYRFVRENLESLKEAI